MDDPDGMLRILDVHESGEVSYRAEVHYEDREDSFGYPPFDHVGPTKWGHETWDGEVGPVEISYVLASASTLGVLASVVKTWLLRNKDRKVHISWEDGKPSVNVTGDLSVEEIERLLRAVQEGKPSPSAAEDDDEQPS